MVEPEPSNILDDVVPGRVEDDTGPNKVGSSRVYQPQLDDPQLYGGYRYKNTSIKNE